MPTLEAQSLTQWAAANPAHVMNKHVTVSCDDCPFRWHTVLTLYPWAHEPSRVTNNQGGAMDQPEQQHGNFVAFMNRDKLPGAGQEASGLLGRLQSRQAPSSRPE